MSFLIKSTQPFPNLKPLEMKSFPFILFHSSQYRVAILIIKLHHCEICDVMVIPVTRHLCLRRLLQSLGLVCLVGLEGSLEVRGLVSVQGHEGGRGRGR